VFQERTHMANMSVQNELARLRQALNPGGAAAAAQPALPAAGPVANFANPAPVVAHGGSSFGKMIKWAVLALVLFAIGYFFMRRRKMIALKNNPQQRPANPVPPAVQQPSPAPMTQQPQPQPPVQQFQQPPVRDPNFTPLS
jgi:hypothetical protein